MTEFFWISSSDEPTTQSLIDDYEILTTQVEEIKQEIIKRYFRSHKLPAWSVKKQHNIRWTEKEFSVMLETLKKIEY